MGKENVTVMGLQVRRFRIYIYISIYLKKLFCQVMKIDTAMNLIYVKGSVPGPKDSLVRIRDAVGRDRFQFDPYTRHPPFPTCATEQLDQFPAELTWTQPEDSAADPIAKLYNLGANKTG